MNITFRKLTLASSIALAIAASANVFGAGTLAEEVTNARQETQIWTTYALNPYLSANDLKVTVHDGTATLAGTVEESVGKDLAGEIARGVAGITNVDNQIAVQSDYVAPANSSSRSFGEKIDDTTITAKIKSKLLWSKHTSGLETEVDTKAGQVTLRGTADSATTKDLVGRMAANTHGVVLVDNRLVVDGSTPSMADASKSAAETAGKDIADSWITAKVKSVYLFSSNVDGSDIGVTTRNGTVTLRGKVDNGAERALAIEFAGNVRGVKHVESKGLVL